MELTLKDARAAALKRVARLKKLKKKDQEQIRLAAYSLKWLEDLDEATYHSILEETL